MIDDVTYYDDDLILMPQYHDVPMLDASMPQGCIATNSLEVSRVGFASSLETASGLLFVLLCVV